MKVHKLSKFSYRGVTVENLWIILDDQGSPPILPLLYTLHLARFGTSFTWKKSKDDLNGRRVKILAESDLHEKTITSYIYNLSQFLAYLEQCKTEHGTPGCHQSERCDKALINHYLNEVLAKQLDSIKSVGTHQAALNAYFAYLEHIEVMKAPDIEVYRKTKQQIAEQSTKPSYIKYITKASRHKLLAHCESLGEKLIMRMGYEVGLRAMENTGLRVGGKNDLKGLFEQLNDSNYKYKERFAYTLAGKYAKYSKTRQIYFSRDLLKDMKRYFETERQKIVEVTGSTEECFFLNRSPGYAGRAISMEHASNVFKNRATEAGLNPNYSYHDLRHTFATELFHEEVVGPSGRETRSESAALIVVGQRLGHSVGKDGHAAPVTTQYVRMRIQMLELEGIEV